MLDDHKSLYDHFVNTNAAGFVFSALVSGLFADYSEFPATRAGFLSRLSSSPSKALTSRRLCGGQCVTRWRILNDSSCKSSPFADSAKNAVAACSSRRHMREEQQFYFLLFSQKNETLAEYVTQSFLK